MSFTGLKLVGVNLGSGSFGKNTIEAVLGKDYTYADNTYIDYYASHNLNLVRLAFKWERVQKSMFGELTESDISAIRSTVDYAASKGMTVVLDMHNYGLGFGGLIGKSSTTEDAFANVWSKLARTFLNDSNVIFGLMNEPNEHTATEWLSSANAAIKAIRQVGATQKILVSGSYWDGAHSWVSSDNDTVIGEGVIDPLKNVSFEVHQYLDADSSGTTTGIVSPSIGAERLKSITEWAEAKGATLFLGEIGVAADQLSLNAFNNTLEYMAQHNHVWDGIAYWAGGPWWGDYEFSIEPLNGVEKPQMNLLDNFVYKRVLEVPTANAIIIAGIGPDELVLKISQDAYQGDAQYTVKVDGVQVGGTLMAAASHALGQSDTLTLKGSWGAGAHQVEVSFLNDAWDGSVSTDRNLYVDGITYNGKAVAASAVSLMSSGAAQVLVPATTTAVNTTLGSGANALVLKISEDAYQGDAQYTVKVDGVQVGGTLTAHASHVLGHSDIVTLNGNWGAGAHQVEVSFLNDAWGGSASTDRNLYVDGITYNDKAVPSSAASLMSAGATSFQVPATALTGDAGNNTLTGTAAGETLSGLGGDDRLVGLAGDDTLLGGDGSDTLEGGDGNDLLDGGAGADRLVGGNGDDVYKVDHLGDGVVEAAGGGTDRVVASVSGYTLAANVERLDLDGSATAGNGNEGANVIVGNALDNALQGKGGDDQIFGNLGNDSLWGGNGNDVLWGGDGNDLLDGGAGADSLMGGAGNDSYIVDSTGDVVVETADGGIDRVISRLSAISLAANVERLDLGAGAVSGSGNELNNFVYGNDLDNVLRGLAGNDKLYGGAGNDTLVGGLGADTLEGGAGADVFRFDSLAEAGDRITDFAPGTDAIEVSVAGFGGKLALGMDVATRFVANTTGLATAPAGTGQFVYETDAAKLWWDADGAGGAAAVTIATFAAGITLHVSDIHLIG